MTKWSEHFTCIAPDTPGFGQSDALPGDPEIDDFADAVTAFLDALGIDKCAAYGFHSGGIILVTAIKRYPNRFTALAVGGYAIWTAEEMELFSDKYLPAFHPSSYGEHLTWLWNRILEQSWFFPWFAADVGHRLSLAHDDPQRVDAVIREMLDAGNAYQAGYGAVLRAPRDIPDTTADVPPCLITAYNGDPLQAHIDRLGDMPHGWSAKKVTSPDDHQTDSLGHLLAAEKLSVNALPEAENEGFILVKTAAFNGQIHWCGERGGDSLYLHAPGEACPEAVPAGMIAIDVPGHGLSDDWKGDQPTDWEQWQAVIDGASLALGTGKKHFPPIPSGDPDRLYPDLSPDRFGHYLTAAWQIVRARQIFEPWYLADVDHAISFDAEALTPERLAIDHLALINARSAKAYHLALQSRSCQSPV